MYTDPVEAEYFEKRLQSSLDMASNAVDAGVVLAHQGFASCYRAKLTSLLRVQAAPPRAVLSLAAFRDKRQETLPRTSPSVFSIAVPAAGCLLEAC
jgi:hypothetical protein